MIVVEVLVRLHVDDDEHAEAEKIAVEAIDHVLTDPDVSNYWVCAVEARRPLGGPPTLAVVKNRDHRSIRRQVSHDLVIIETKED